MNYADILDIILLTILIYLVIKLMRDTRAEQLLKGVIVVVVIFVVVEICELKAMSFLIENFLQVGIIAIIVVFQPELRRILERVGRSKVTKIAFSSIEQSSDDKNSPFCQPGRKCIIALHVLNHSMHQLYHCPDFFLRLPHHAVKLCYMIL